MWISAPLPSLGTCMPSEYTRELPLVERLFGGYKGATRASYDG